MTVLPSPRVQSNIPVYLTFPEYDIPLQVPRRDVNINVSHDQIRDGVYIVPSNLLRLGIERLVPRIPGADLIVSYTSLTCEIVYAGYYTHVVQTGFSPAEQPDRDRPIVRFRIGDSCTLTRILGSEIYTTKPYDMICDHKRHTPSENCTSVSNAVSGRIRPAPASAAAN